MRKRTMTILSGVIGAVMMAAALCGSVSAESAGLGENTQYSPEEEGYSEIQDMLDASSVKDREGKNLEELTDTLTEQALSEYYDPTSGIHIQYPSVLRFSEDEKQTIAADEDGLTVWLEEEDDHEPEEAS